MTRRLPAFARFTKGRAPVGGDVTSSEPSMLAFVKAVFVQIDLAAHRNRCFQELPHAHAQLGQYPT